MKCLAFFRGEVTCVLPGGTRIVKLWRPYKKNAESVIADMKRNHAKGFKVGQLFESRVMKEPGKEAWVQIKKWKPKELTKRQLSRIMREVEEWSSTIDWDNI